MEIKKIQVTQELKLSWKYPPPKKTVYTCYEELNLVDRNKNSQK